MLDEAGIESAGAEAGWIVRATLGNDAALAHDVAADSARRALELAARRASREPLQYVLGTAPFRRLELAVGPGIFIPRPETELVAERAMALLPEGGTVVDIGTGSGAIALSIADERAGVTVLATEVSEPALSWARKNISATGLPVQLFHGELFDPLPQRFRGNVDVVVSNPPYVAGSDPLPEEVRDHEPHTALYSGSSGLEVIERLTAGAREWLRPHGSLVVEIGESQAESASAMVLASGFEGVTVAEDLSHRPRIVSATLSA